MPLTNLKAGDVFGEEVLVSGVTRNATVTMKFNGVLLHLGRQDFLALLQEPLLHKLSYEQAMQAVAQAGYDVQVLDGGLWSVPRSMQQ